MSMDKLSPQPRHANMAAIRSKDTKPEMIVRRGSRRDGRGRGGVVAGGCGGFARRCVVDGLCGVRIKFVKKYLKCSGSSVKTHYLCG